MSMTPPQGQWPGQPAAAPADPLAAANQMLNGGGATAFFNKDTPIGAFVEGQVVEAHEAQRTDFATGVPLTWDDGKPKMQLVVTIQTTLRETPDDDGLRSLYLHGSAGNAQSSLGAVSAAVKAAGVPMQVGGTLGVAYTGIGVSTRPGMNPPKLWAARYAGPVINMPADGGSPFAGQPQAQPQQQPVGMGAPQQAPQQAFQQPAVSPQVEQQAAAMVGQAFPGAQPVGQGAPQQPAPPANPFPQQ